MAIAREQIEAFMDGIGGRPEDNLKMLLYYGDLSGDFADDDDWGALCEFALEVDDELGMSEQFAAKYHQLIIAKEFQQALDLMDYDLKDNKIFAAMAIHKMGVPKNIPMIASAAYNKHAYAGLKDEFALVRFLHWSGFDIDGAYEQDGMTPLHFLAFTAPAPGSHPRAVEWLLDHGADVEAVNVNGDTALAYLCGSQSWSPSQSRSLFALLNAGADLLCQANDGTTPYSLLRQTNEIEFSEERAAILSAFAEMLAAAEGEIEARAASDADVQVPAPNLASASTEHAGAANAKDSPEPVDAELREPLLSNEPSSSELTAAREQAAEPGAGKSNEADIEDSIPPELMAAAKAWREKGGNLGALGRWAFKSSAANPTPESVARLLKSDIEWAKRRMGTPEGDRIIAEARSAARLSDGN